MKKRVLITAAAGGIGAAIARSAKTDGYDVVISDIDTASGEKLASEIGATFIACNLANEDEVVALVAKTGAVDVLVNNGGIAGPRHRWQNSGPRTGISSLQSTRRPHSSPAAKWFV